MSGPPDSMRSALEQAMAQRTGAGGAPPQAGPTPQQGPAPEQVAQACGLAGQLLMALASNPQAIQQIMAAAQGGGTPQPGVPGQ